MAKHKKKPVRPHLRVLRGSHGKYVVHEQLFPTSSGANESIDPSVIIRRARAVDIARRALDAGYSLQFVKEGSKAPAHGDYHMLKVVLEKPITAGDYKFIEQPAIEAGLMHSGATEPDDKPKIIAPSFLTETSKMGCYSFNVPAGPTVQGGTCPASAVGFMYLSAEEQRKYAQQMPKQAGNVSEQNFICNGCYALKKSYGYTSMVVVQAIRLELLKRWTKKGEIVDRFVDFIRAGQLASMERRGKNPADVWEYIPDPNFFRIHDAGDLFSRAYTDIWFEVCKRMPDVLFWAPTRMWAMSSAASTRFRKGIPANLALRPSSLHFRTLAPPVVNPGTHAASLYGQTYPGIAAGSGSGDVCPEGTWACPAYEHQTKLGGALPRLSVKGKIIGTKDGKCPRAHGPNSPARGGNDPLDLPLSEGGYGCRACWRNKDLPIFYHEH
jgi:hypothetical protein